MIHFDVTAMQTELNSLEEQTLKSGFWNDGKKSGIILQNITSLKNKIQSYINLQKKLKELLDMNELLIAELDSDLSKELLEETKLAEKEIENLEIQTLLSGSHDKLNAIITLHPGAGGTESQDWVQMLYRMYTRWANQNGYQVKELDYLEGEEAGIKSVTALGRR